MQNFIRKISVWTAALLVLLSLGLVPAAGREVKIDYRGFELIGELEIVPGKSLQKQGVFLILHDVMSHLDGQPVAELRSSLLAQGFNVLAVNLSLGLDGRKGRFDCAVEQDHRFTYALPEIHAWVKWLQSRKTSKITLLGVGLGGNQMALYGTKTTQKEVRSLILLGPRQSLEQLARLQYQQQYGKALADILFDAQAQISSLSGGTLLEKTGFFDCQQARVSARSFLSYYGENTDFSLSKLIAVLKKPILVIAGESGDDSANLLAAMQQSSARPNLRLEIIETADARFGGAFLKRVVERIKVFRDDTKRQ